MTTDAAKPAEEFDDPQQGMLALFERAQQLYDQFTADNDELDRAWRRGNPAEVIRELQQRARKAADRIKVESTEQQAQGASDGRPTDATT